MANCWGRIRSIRKKFAQDMGFLPPVVHIRDNMDLPPARYRILMKGVEIGSGEAYPGRWLAINPRHRSRYVTSGEQTVDPAFGLTAIWIESALKEQAQIQWLYGGGSQYRGGDAPQPFNWSVCIGTVWPCRKHSSCLTG